MLFFDLAKYLEKLEGTSSRLEITSILTDLFDKTISNEIQKVTYLSLGVLAPNYEGVLLNLAEKMMVRAISLAYGLSLENVARLYKKEGDLGSVAEKLAPNVNNFKKLTVDDVYKKLIDVAKEGGEGSQDKKIELMSNLLKELDPLSVRFVARIPVGKLRLGFSEKTIFDALSQMNSGGKTLRKELDKVFQIYPDPGYITKVVKERGMSGLKNVKVKTGVPVVPALCQRLDNYQEIVEKMGVVAVERKYDGTRVQIHFNNKKNEIRTYTRNLEESSPMFPELQHMKEWIKADEVILDCEAVGYDRKTNKVLPFQITITRKRKHDVAETAKSIPLRFFVFDILSLNGVSLIDKPYFERRKSLAEIIKNNATIVTDEYYKTDDPTEVQKMHDKFLKEGFEGAVIKMWNGEYLPGRQGWNWVKIKEAEGTSGKLSDTLDLIILGYYLGRGKRAGFGIGAFLVGLRKGESWVSIAKVGTGLTDEEFRELKKNLDRLEMKEKPSNYQVTGALVPDVWVEPSVVVEVAADEITKSPNHAGGVALRFPRLIRFREDKGPKQATTWKEVEEIAKLSRS